MRTMVSGGIAALCSALALAFVACSEDSEPAAGSGGGGASTGGTGGSSTGGTGGSSTGGTGGSSTGGMGGSSTGGTGGSTGGSGGDDGGSPDAEPDGGGGTGGDPGDGGPVAISGHITTDTTLTADKEYLLDGFVFVDAPATLTIEAGTLIKGRLPTGDEDPGALIVLPGAKIRAMGTATDPIVFTSQRPFGFQQPGDWAGVVLLGQATRNNTDPIEGLEGIQYGGANDDDSSGEMHYVRIEYPGYVIGPNNELNGLTFGAVGRGTTIDHIQVRRAADDCFEFFGGTVNAKYLICQHNEDDGFDWDNGYRGKLQFLVLQQNPTFVGDNNGFEGDNDATGSEATPLSSPTIFNATLCGKNRNPDIDKEQYGILVRRRSQLTASNLIVTGFEAGIDVRLQTGQSASAPGISITSSIFFGNIVHNVAWPEDGTPGVPQQANDDLGLDEAVYYMDAATKNSVVDPGITGCFDALTPKFAPSAELSANATMPPNDGFFDQVAYIGAVKDATDTWPVDAWTLWSDQ